MFIYVQARKKKKKKIHYFLRVCVSPISSGKCTRVILVHPFRHLCVGQKGECPRQVCARDVSNLTSVCIAKGSCGEKHTGEVVKTHQDVSLFHSHCCCGVFFLPTEAPVEIGYLSLLFKFSTPFFFSCHILFSTLFAVKESSSPVLLPLETKKKKRRQKVFHFKEKHYILHMPHILYCIGSCSGVKGHEDKNS